MSGLYNNYAKRACENLGVPYETKDESSEDTPLSESDYPKEFKKMTRKEREDFANRYDSDEDFLSQFSSFNKDKFVNEKTFADKREILL